MEPISVVRARACHHRRRSIRSGHSIRGRLRRSVSPTTAATFTRRRPPAIWRTWSGGGSTKDGWNSRRRVRFMRVAMAKRIGCGVCSAPPEAPPSACKSRTAICSPFRGSGTRTTTAIATRGGLSRPLELLAVNRCHSATHCCSAAWAVIGKIQPQVETSNNSTCTRLSEPPTPIVGCNMSAWAWATTATPREPGM